MKTNNFEAFSKTSAGRCSATLSKKFSTIPPKKLWDAVHSEAVFALPHLMEGGKYTTEQLCGPEIWSPWLTVERRIAGMCLAYLVKVGAIPLVLHLTPSGNGMKRYQRPLKAGVAPLDPTLRTILLMTLAQ
jgi:hypothetical protein